MRERIAGAALAVAGALTSLVGLVMVLLGFADRDIARIGASLSFMLTACFTTLVTTMLVANPLEDRRAKREGVWSPVSRAAWVLFPIATLLVLVITFVLAITPMEVKA